MYKYFWIFFFNILVQPGSNSITPSIQKVPKKSLAFVFPEEKDVDESLSQACSESILTQGNGNTEDENRTHTVLIHQSEDAVTGEKDKPTIVSSSSSSSSVPPAATATDDREPERRGEKEKTSGPSAATSSVNEVIFN